MRKDSPSVGDVHVSAALGNQSRPRRWKDFKTFVGQGSGTKIVVPSDHGPGDNQIGDPAYKRYGSTKELPKPVRSKLKGKDRRQWLHVFNSSIGRYGDESRAFAEAWAVANKVDTLSNPPMVGVGGRRLEPYDAATYFTPFRYDAAALGYLREDQIPRFLDAVTHPKRLDLVEIPLNSVVAIKNRVDPKVVRKHLDNVKKLNPPVVVAVNDTYYLADGHDRATAMWLNGADTVQVMFDDLRPFSDVKPDPSVDHVGSLFDLLQGADGRTLVAFRDGTLMVPFRHDSFAIAKLRPDQVPSFIFAITHPEDLPQEEISLASLVAIQNRVNADTVAKHVEKGLTGKKKPVIIRNNGMNYLADGHDRLTAAWLRGEDTATVSVKDVTTLDNTMKREVEEAVSFSVDITKILPKKRQIFGWASVCTIGGEHVIDKQGDIVPVEALEPAVYEYVLSSRDGSDMHVERGASRMIESAMFTKEKQAALKIDLGREGWWGGWQIDSPKLWDAIERGERPELSIGGAAISKEIQ